MDDLIPFCEYFIIPYVLWFLVVLGSVMYFALGSPGKKEYYQYMATLGVGMTLFLIISFVYPNGQNLRPELTGEGPFIQAVQLLYQTDTPTNIFPSIHVFNAVACCVALLNNKKMQTEQNLYSRKYCADCINRSFHYVFKAAQCGRCSYRSDPQCDLLSDILQDHSGKYA